MKMSCLHYQMADPRNERTYLDMQYPRNSYTPTSRTPRIGSPCSEICGSGSYSGWVTPEINSSCNVTPREAGRGDPPFLDANMQILTGRMGDPHSYDSPKHRDSNSNVSIKKIQARLKFLEDSNTVMQTRNQNLITENKELTSQLDRKTARATELEGKIATLQEEFRRERTKLKVELDKQMLGVCERRDASTTHVITTSDRSTQIWAVCKGCEKKLEGCEKEPPTVTITRSELETLENDMQALRDAVIAREEAWDKAMEREQNYRQQLTRLTAETITARHLYETRQDELQAVTEALTGKESELKSMQRETQYLNQLICKLNKRQKGLEENLGNSSGSDLNEKDQKFIDEIVRRISNMKGKRKMKTKNGTEKIGGFNNQHSPLANNTKITESKEKQRNIK